MSITPASTSRAITNDINSPLYEKYADERIAKAVSAGNMNTDMTFRTNAEATAARNELRAAGYSVSEVQDLNWPLDSGHLLNVGWSGGSSPTPTPAPPAPVPVPPPPPGPPLTAFRVTEHTSIAPGIDAGMGPLQLTAGVYVEAVVASTNAPFVSQGFGVAYELPPGLSFSQSGGDSIIVSGTPGGARPGYYFTILTFVAPQPGYIPYEVGCGVWIVVSEP